MKQLIKKILKESIKEKLEKRLKEDGLMETLNTLGIDIYQLSDMLNTTPIELIRKNLIDKKLNNTDFNINNGGYNFNFIITDIDDEGIDNTWVVDVEILDGSVDLIMTGGGTYDLWDSDLWEEDFWWEIQNEIDDIITDILNPYKPEDIDLEIMHNLR
jgi:hypothetical protein